MYSRNCRLEADTHETRIVDWSDQIGELRESLVDEVMVPVAELYQDRPLCDRPATPADLDALTRLGPWGCALELYPGVTGVDLDRQAPVVDFTPESREAQSIRLSLLDKALTEFAPVGSLLDLETDCGLIPMKLADRIGGRIVGIDRRAEAIGRATLLHSLGRRSNRRFETADPAAYLARLNPDAFDCVSALGVFDRQAEPIRLLRLMYEKTARLVLIDTAIHNIPVPGWVRMTDTHAPAGAAADAGSASVSVALQPTYRGLIDSLYQVGFESVTEVAPAPSLLAAVPQQTAYHSHRRALFVAHKWVG